MERSARWALFGTSLIGALTCATVGPARPLPAVHRIVIRKDRHELTVFAISGPVKTYSVALGRGGRGPKRIEGDGKTPEGVYRVTARRHSREFHRFLALSYPNAADRRAFRALRLRGAIPVGSRMGGAIGIHGESRAALGLPHKLVDWTLGCIALDDDEIEELYLSVRVGTPVEILP